MAHRLDRLVDRGTSGDRGRLIRDVAAETGLGPEEVRAEWEEIRARTRRFGPPSAEQVVRRCAEEFGLPKAEVWAEYDRISGTAETSRRNGWRSG